MQLNPIRLHTAKNLNSRKGAKPEFIVLHDTSGNGTTGDVKYLANDPEKRGVSVDFVVPKDGTIFQLTTDIHNAYTNHAGRRTRFRGYEQAQVNRHSVGIEIGQKANMSGLDPKYPTAQIDAVARLCVWLCEQLGLQKTDITTHSKIITDGSRSDPREFPWHQFWDLFNTYADDQGLAQGDGIFHTVVKGDTLYSLSAKYLTSVEKIKALNDMDIMTMTIKVGQVLKVKE